MSEIQKDEIRIIVLSILLAIFFGIVQTEENFSNVFNQENINESFKLLGLTTIVITKSSLIFIILTIGYLLSLCWKYSSKKTKCIKSINEFLYSTNIFIYSIIFLFSIIFYFLIILTNFGVSNPLLNSIILILLLLGIVIYTFLNPLKKIFKSS